MSRITRYGRMRARDGHGEELAVRLLAAADDLRSDPGCELYIVNRDVAEPNLMWITEMWRSKGDLDAALERIRGGESVAAVLELVANADAVELELLGGKLPAAVDRTGTTPLVESPAVEHFLAAYRAAFETFDAGAIADLFVYPCQIVSDADEITVMTIGSRGEWIPRLERLVGSYRQIGVRTAEIRDLHTVQLPPRLALVTVRWRLVDAEGESIYDFDAAYTLVDRRDGLRITSLAHNEMPHLRRAGEVRRAG